MLRDICRVVWGTPLRNAVAGRRTGTCLRDGRFALGNGVLDDSIGSRSPPKGLTLLQSVDDPTVFHTMGWFHIQEDLDAMREHTHASQLLEDLVKLSSEFRPQLTWF